MAYQVNADGTQSVVFSTFAIDLNGVEQPGCGVTIGSYAFGDALIVPAGTYDMSALIVSTDPCQNTATLEWLDSDELVGTVVDSDVHGGGTDSFSLSGRATVPAMSKVFITSNGSHPPTGTITADSYLRLECLGRWWGGVGGWS